MKVRRVFGLFAFLGLACALSLTGSTMLAYGQGYPDFDGNNYVDGKDLIMFEQFWQTGITPIPTLPPATSTPTITPTRTPTATTVPTNTPLSDGNYGPIAIIKQRGVSTDQKKVEKINSSLSSGQHVLPVNSTVYLLGSGTDPEGSDIVGYNWSVNGPGLSAQFSIQDVTFTPPREGRYQVALQVTDASGGVGGLTTKEIVSAKYVGIRNCASCHDGSHSPLHDQVTNYSETAHASMFARGIDGLVSSSYKLSCISCHTTGYDALSNGNDGFDDLATALGWIFPVTKTAGNWDALEADMPELANVGNIQCEACHGPGSLHNGDKTAISSTIGVGACAVCHDAPKNHSKVLEWETTGHANPPDHGCAPCHGKDYFVYFYDPDYAGKPIPADVDSISCAACHDPHNASNEYQLRTLEDYTLMNGVVVTEEENGTGLLCIHCHHSRRDVRTYVNTYSSRFGPHYGPQGDMFNATGGYDWVDEGDPVTVDFLPHRELNGCVSCHMATQPTGVTPANAVGNHTWRMQVAAGQVEGVTETTYNTTACAQCHDPEEVGTWTAFDRPAYADYDGDGTVEGLQTEVLGLMDVLGGVLPPDGTTVTVTSSYTAVQLKAAYNYMFVLQDKSNGIHQPEYTIKLLQTSYRQLTGSDVPGAAIR